ncbi:MAG: DUF433 domain-containing protein [Frankia sp.]
MTVIDLLDRPAYGMSQIDRILLLPPGTARRWIEGYRRAGRDYPPVIRAESTGVEIATWGEFVETRLLAGYRDRGVPLLRMRPAIQRLREEFGTRYPLAYSQPFTAGRDLVRAVQEDVGLERSLQFVVVRSGQQLLDLTAPADEFYRTTEFSESDGSACLIRPLAYVPEVRIDPLRGYGEPVVRSVPTEVIAEQIRAGDNPEHVAELFEISRIEVIAALRYELSRRESTNAA